MAEIVCGRCVRKEMALDLETRMAMAKAIVPDEIYECATCNTSFYFHKFRMVYIGDKVPVIHKSVLE